MPRWLTTATLLMVALLVAGSARASEAPAPSLEPTAASTPSSAAAARLEVLRPLLDSEAHRASLWTWGWVATYWAMTVGQLIPIPFVDEGSRTDLWVGAATTAVGALALAVMPLEVKSAADLPADPELAVAEAERRLHAGATAEREGFAWTMHALNVAFNVAVGLVLGLGYDRWESGLVGTVVGIAVGEVTLFSQPRRLIDLDDTRPHARLLPFVSPHGAGLTFALSF